MSKTRKLLSIAVAVAMLLSVLAVGVFAGIGYSDDTDAAHTQVWSLSTPVDNGDGTYSVDVSLTTTYATGAIEFMIENTDTAVAELSDAVAGAALPFDADVTFSYTTGKVMIIPVTSGKTFLPGAAIDGVIATLTFAYAGEGSATINIAEDAKSTTNVGGTLIAAYAENLLDGSVKVGQAATFVDNSQVIGASAALEPELVVIDGTAGVIDDKGFVYGIDCNNWLLEEAETVWDVFTVNNGYMEIVPSEYGEETATGAVLQVYYATGELYAEYTIVVYGDVDGDGLATATDGIVLEEFELGNFLLFEDYTGVDTFAALRAGDVNADGLVDSSDGILLEEFELGVYDNLHDIFEQSAWTFEDDYEADYGWLYE